MANIRNGDVELPKNQISSTTTTSGPVLRIPKNHSKDTNIDEDSDDNSEVPGLIDDDDSDNEDLDPILAEQRVNERIEREETKHGGANQPFADDNWHEVHVQQRIFGTAYDPDVISPPRNNRRFGGPTNIPKHVDRESDFLNLLFTDELLQTIADASNAYNHSIDPEGKKFWKLPCHDITVLLYMGILRLPNRQMYFESEGIFANSFVPNQFSKRRFDAICQVIHYVNTNGITAAERKRRNQENPFWTIEDMLNDLAEKFRKYYELGFQVDVDEMCIPFKG